MGVLKQAGLKVTQPRILVARTLASADRPLGAYALTEKIREAGHKVDVVSTYRTLDMMQRLGLIHFIHQSEGFAICHGHHDHPDRIEHAICKQCGEVKELTVPLGACEDIQSQVDEIGFHLGEVKIELSGTCTKCQAHVSP